MTAAIDCFIGVTDSTEFLARLTALCNDIRLLRVPVLKVGSVERAKALGSSDTALFLAEVSATCSRSAISSLCREWQQVDLHVLVG